MPRAPSRTARSTTIATVTNTAAALDDNRAADDSAHMHDTIKTGSALHAILTMAAVSIAPSAWDPVSRPSIVQAIYSAFRGATGSITTKVIASGDRPPHRRGRGAR